MAVQFSKPYADVKDCGGLNSTGWSNGSLVIDHLTIGPKTAADVSFYLMKHVQHFNPRWASDGLMGLSISIDCYLDKDNCTILGFLKAFGDPVVGVYLPSNQLVGQGSAGAITFGSLDLPECSSNWRWLSDTLKNLPGWNILVKSFDLGSYHAPLTDRPAILFSFAAYIWAPPKVFNKIVSTLGAEYSFSDDEYVVECSKVNKGQLPDMSFTLNGTMQ
ncbi:aspartic protease, partial [Aphelenchoides avenae]